MSREELSVIDVIGYAFLPPALLSEVPIGLTVIPVKFFILKALSGSSGFYHHFPEVFIRGSWSLYRTRLVPQTRPDFCVLSSEKELITDLLFVRRTDWLPRITTRMYQKVPVYSDTLKPHVTMRHQRLATTIHGRRLAQASGKLNARFRSDILTNSAILIAVIPPRRNFSAAPFIKLPASPLPFQ
ncbi:hypothetical protein F5888DRAFT_221629 [Russula emetica]|nr:hypothetical protein F5888DRAFT_221629 [Russula emetica]